MKKFNEFINESSQYVYLNDGRGGQGFRTNKYPRKNQRGVYSKSISNLNQKIKTYIDNLYGPFGFRYGVNDDINVNGIIINGEYISKMVNNYTIFKAFIRENNIKDEESFYNLIESSFDDVYNYKGDFFKRNSLPILINTTRKGNINEEKTLDKFEQVVKSKGTDIKIVRPTVEEDVKGIDGKFLLNGRYFTIQVKPFTSVTESNDTFYAESAGSLSLGVNYLALYNGDNYIILKNPNNNKITIEGSNFVYNSRNVLFKSI